MKCLRDSRVAATFFIFTLVGAMPTSAIAVEFFDLLLEFNNSAGSTDIANFDGVPLGPAPFTDGGLSVLESSPFNSSVADQEVGQGHSFWFPTGSAPNFVMTGAITDSTPDDESGFMIIEFAEDVNAAGFLYTCFACDAEPDQSEIFLHFYNRAGETILFTSRVFDLSVGERFFGLITSFPFAQLRLGTVEIGGDGGGNWFMDDFQYVTLGDRVFANGFED